MLKTIAEIRTTRKHAEANRLLSFDWVLIETHLIQSSEVMVYVMGRPAGVAGDPSENVDPARR